MTAWARDGVCGVLQNHWCINCIGECKYPPKTQIKARCTHGCEAEGPGEQVFRLRLKNIICMYLFLSQWVSVSDVIVTIHRSTVSVTVTVNLYKCPRNERPHGLLKSGHPAFATTWRAPIHDRCTLPIDHLWQWLRSQRSRAAAAKAFLALSS